jgi:hypothetical protein
VLGFKKALNINSKTDEPTLQRLTPLKLCVEFSTSGDFNPQQHRFCHLSTGRPARSCLAINLTKASKLSVQKSGDLPKMALLFGLC